MTNIWPGGKCIPVLSRDLLKQIPLGLGMWWSGSKLIDQSDSKRAQTTIDTLGMRANSENVF